MSDIKRPLRPDLELYVENANLKSRLAAALERNSDYQTIIKDLAEAAKEIVEMCNDNDDVCASDALMRLENLADTYLVNEDG